MASDDKRVTLKREPNTAGTVYALVRNDTRNTYEVWIKRANYSGQVRGGMQYSWRYVQMDMDKSAAEALFNKKLQGKTK